MVKEAKKPKDTVLANMVALEETMRELMERVSMLEQVAMSGVGLDPAIARRAHMERIPIQFKARFNSAALSSKVQKGCNVKESFSVVEGIVGLMLVEDVQCIAADFPDLMTTDPDDFIPRFIHKRVHAFNEDGKPVIKNVTTKISVEDLLRTAVELG